MASSVASCDTVRLHRGASSTNPASGTPSRATSCKPTSDEASRNPASNRGRRTTPLKTMLLTAWKSTTSIHGRTQRGPLRLSHGRRGYNTGCDAHKAVVKPATQMSTTSCLSVGPRRFAWTECWICLFRQSSLGPSCNSKSFLVDVSDHSRKPCAAPQTCTMQTEAGTRSAKPRDSSRAQRLKRSISGAAAHGERNL